MYIGDKSKINLTSDNFEEFIENDYLYVDKTKFIENIILDANSVLLFTRPRRMGKSLNMSTLATFLDMIKDTSYLFNGLYIRDREVFKYCNQYPVAYFRFKDYNIDDFEKLLKREIINFLKKYLKQEDYDRVILRFIEDDNDFDPTILKYITGIIYNKIGKKTCFIVDEYDKLIIDNINNEKLEKMVEYLTRFLSSMCKSNEFLRKAVLTGVTRIAKANMFSQLNNIDVYDVLTSSRYDTDFSLTEEEVKELVHTDNLEEVRNWYNNMSVGDTKLYNVYSVMSYLSKNQAINFWDMTGSSRLLTDMMNKERASVIQSMMINRELIRVNLKNSIELLELNPEKCTDETFYSLAVQAGYLSCNIERHPYVSGQMPRLPDYYAYVPNWEAYIIWDGILKNSVLRNQITELQDIFKYIENIELFSNKLEKVLMTHMSYQDIVGGIESKENVYHMFILGMTSTLGYTCVSNREYGLGRPDIIITDNKTFHMIIELKIVNKEYKTTEEAAEGAMRQIDEKKYWLEVQEGLTIYKVGVGSKGKECTVRAERHKVV